MSKYNNNLKKSILYSVRYNEITILIGSTALGRCSMILRKSGCNRHKKRESRGSLKFDRLVKLKCCFRVYQLFRNITHRTCRDSLRQSLALSSSASCRIRPMIGLGCLCSPCYLKFGSVLIGLRYTTFK